MEIRRRQTSAQSASESAALGKAGHGSAETGRAVPSAQSKKEPLAALFLCVKTRRIRGGTPHPPRQARHLPPLGKAWLDCGNTIPAKPLKQSKLCTLHESRSDPLPSPVGEGGPRQRWMRCSRTAATGRRGTFFGFAREIVGVQPTKKNSAGCLLPPLSPKGSLKYVLCLGVSHFLTPQTGGTRWGARSGRTAPRGLPRQMRAP